MRSQRVQQAWDSWRWQSRPRVRSSIPLGERRDRPRHAKFYYLDLNHDHTVDYRSSVLPHGFYRWLLRQSCPVYLSPASGNGELAYLGGRRTKPKPCLLDYALKPGDSIGPKRRFSPEKGGLVELHINRRSGYNKYGVWNDAGNRYLGLKFKINGETHYGWARLNVLVQGGNGIEARADRLRLRNHPQQSHHRKFLNKEQTIAMSSSQTRGCAPAMMALLGIICQLGNCVTVPRLDGSVLT